MAKAILLVEDSQDDELFFMRVLKKSGMINPVHVVRDGADALSYFKGEREFAAREKYPLPEILFLDLAIPRVSGFEVLEWIGTQEHLKKMLIVVLSHMGDTKNINRAYSLGAHSFLTKPVQEPDLLHLANHFSGHWQMGS